MSYQTGTATDPEDLMQKLDTFLTGTPGWTSELFSTANNRAIWSKAGVSRKIFADWDADKIGISMITDSPSPNDVPLLNQNGGEFVTATIANRRHCNLISGPYPSYHFFEDDDHVHVVIEKDAGIYRHFGFGQLLKLGSWTGGAYAYGHYWDQSTTSIDNPYNTNHFAAMSGSNGFQNARGGGLHAVGLPDQPVNGKYLRETTSTTVDDDGDPVRNMFPSGWADGQNTQFIAAGQSQLNGFKPLIPVPLYQWFFSTPDRARLLGYLPDMRVINLVGLNVAQEITVASDTWIVFPVVRKTNQGLTFNEEQSWDIGIAYKKVTT